MGTPDLFEEIVRLRRAGTPAALATIVETRGSTPGRSGMRLLVLGDGTFLGTVGGGCLEAEVYDTAREVIRTERPETLKFRLTEKESQDSGLMCGGEVTIFVEPLTSPALWIFGGGHISKDLCRVAALAGFRVTVADDRPAYATAKRFPEAVATLASPFAEAVAGMPLTESSYVVIVTRGHQQDGAVLEAFWARHRLGEAPRFLGMIGSHAKKLLLFKHLTAGGASEAFLGRVRCPVGLAIGARSHEEIAVSIVAELVSVRRVGIDGAAGWVGHKGRRRPRPRPLARGAGSADGA